MAPASRRSERTATCVSEAADPATNASVLHAAGLVVSCAPLRAPRYPAPPASRSPITN
jgi:hypothetical protein